MYFLIELLNPYSLSVQQTGIKFKKGSTIKKKNIKSKAIISPPFDTNDQPPSLSIEERVKLRRTTPFLTPIKPLLKKTPQSNIKKRIEKPLKRIQSTKTKKDVIKSKKFFLGSGLDLDNIVLGNRQRRCVKT